MATKRVLKCKHCEKFPRQEYGGDLCNVCEAIVQEGLRRWEKDGEAWLAANALETRIIYDTFLRSVPYIEIWCKRCQEPVQDVFFNLGLNGVEGEIKPHTLETCFESLISRIKRLESKFNF